MVNSKIVCGKEFYAGETFYILYSKINEIAILESKIKTYGNVMSTINASNGRIEEHYVIFASREYKEVLKEMKNYIQKRIKQVQSNEIAHW